MDYGARYGIWGMPTERRGVLRRTLDTAEQTQGLFGQLFENMEKKQKADELSLKNKETQETMANRILATNTKNSLDAEYYPKEKEANIKQLAAKLGLTEAQTRQALAQANESNALAKLHGSNSQLVQGLSGQILKDPKFGGKNGAGGTYTDPITGKVISSPTTAQTTRDQKTIASDENLQQYFGTVIEKLPKFQGAMAHGKLLGQGISNYILGTDYRGPSDYAEGKAAVKKAAEGALNEFGLNATGENVNKMIDIFTPKIGESEKGYRARAQRDAAEFVQQSMRAQSRLSQGIDVTPKQTISKSQVANLAKRYGIEYGEMAKQVTEDGLMIGEEDEGNNQEDSGIS